MDSIIRTFLATIAWRKIKAILISKPGKNTYYEATFFKPTSLSSLMLKTIKKLVNTYLKEEILTEKPFQKNQFTFEKGESTVDALYAFTSGINNTKRKGGVAIVANQQKILFYLC